MKLRNPFCSASAAFALVIAAGLSAGAYAQDGYHVGESGVNDATQNAPSNAPSEATGPVRIARFSYVDGNVTWRPDGDTDWTSGAVNTPMRQGAQVWVGDGGRAEIQFDDGSILRVGSGAVVTLQTLYSDDQGEFTELKMTDGLASMDLRTDHSIYQIDTPRGSVKSVGPSRFRVGVDDDVELGVREGAATLDGPQGKLTLKSGDYLDVQNDHSAYNVQALPEEDSWDKFTDERQAQMTKVDTNLPQNMQYVAGDMDRYGTWRDDSQYGKVWQPQEPESWAPYRDGNWVWCDPFGWTWVGAEPWGWAPYHYGSWIHRGWGWGWVPGPAYQYWSPAVVSFSCYGDNVCWAPLSPFECVYPSAFSVGFFGVGWGAFFSIGGCGLWYPHGDHACWERPWNSGFVNHWHGWDHGFGHGWDRNIGSVAFNRQLGGAWSNAHFVPTNARFGGTEASAAGFASGHHDFRAVSGEAGLTAFSRGRVVGAGRGEPMSGPVGVARPGATSWTPSRTETTRPLERTGVIGRSTYGQTSRGGLQRYEGTTPFGSRNSSAASAAAAARQSLGWSPRSSGGAFSGARTEGHSFGETRGDRSLGGGGGSFNRSGGFGESRSEGRQSTGRSSSRSWGIQNHGGWSHQHSDNFHGGGGDRSFGGGGDRSSGGGGRSSGGGGGGNRGGRGG